jgi:hypothetical protein
MKPHIQLTYDVNFAFREFENLAPTLIVQQERPVMLGIRVRGGGNNAAARTRRERGFE